QRGERVLAEIGKRALRIAATKPPGGRRVGQDCFLASAVKRSVQRRVAKRVDLGLLFLGPPHAEECAQPDKRVGSGFLIRSEVRAGRIELPTRLREARHRSVVLKLRSLLGGLLGAFAPDEPAN